MDKKEVLKIILKSAKEYDENLLNNIMFVSDNYNVEKLFEGTEAMNKIDKTIDIYILKNI